MMEETKADRLAKMAKAIDSIQEQLNQLEDIALVMGIEIKRMQEAEEPKEIARPFQVERLAGVVFVTKDGYPYTFFNLSDMPQYVAFAAAEKCATALNNYYDEVHPAETGDTLPTPQPPACGIRTA
jgi:hypothetical protein